MNDLSIPGVLLYEGDINDVESLITRNLVSLLLLRFLLDYCDQMLPKLKSKIITAESIHPLWRQIFYHYSKIIHLNHIIFIQFLESLLFPFQDENEQNEDHNYAHVTDYDIHC